MSLVLVLLLFLLLVILHGRVHAHPQRYNCEGKTWLQNAKFGHMLVDEFSYEKTECTIHGIPSRFRPGKHYEIRIKSTEPLGHKLVVENGILKGAKVRRSCACDMFGINKAGNL